MKRKDPLRVLLGLVFAVLLTLILSFAIAAFAAWMAQTFSK